MCLRWRGPCSALKPVQDYLYQVQDSRTCSIDEIQFSRLKCSLHSSLKKSKYVACVSVGNWRVETMLNASGKTTWWNESSGSLSWSSRRRRYAGIPWEHLSRRPAATPEAFKTKKHVTWSCKIGTQTANVFNAIRKNRITITLSRPDPQLHFSRYPSRLFQHLMEVGL